MIVRHQVSSRRAFNCFIFLLIISFSAYGQTYNETGKIEPTSIYSLALKDYINAVQERKKIIFDTLFIGNRKNGQKDDFPDILLPSKINTTSLIQIDMNAFEHRQKSVKGGYYLNMMGWISSSTAEFVFVLFKNGFSHDFDCSSNYTFDKNENRFQLSSLEFK